MSRKVFTLIAEHRAGNDEFRPRNPQVVAEYRSHLAAIRAASILQYSYRILLGKGTFTTKEEGLIDGKWISACWRKNNSPRYLVILSVFESVQQEDFEDDSSNEGGDF
ncbi:hypothetical protein MMC32_003107 [Xylographa parallela]|nr:hypothetical protein [Xylographa parallela]